MFNHPVLLLIITSIACWSYKIPTRCRFMLLACCFHCRVCGATATTQCFAWIFPMWLMSGNSQFLIYFLFLSAHIHKYYRHSRFLRHLCAYCSTGPLLTPMNRAYMCIYVYMFVNLYANTYVVNFLIFRTSVTSRVSRADKQRNRFNGLSAINASLTLLTITFDHCSFCVCPTAWLFSRLTWHTIIYKFT